ncbi:MAG: DUF456 domain-containing protein [Bacteroidota bacterium]
MDILLVILCILCALVGIIGVIVPGLPGTPLSFIALILLHLTKTFNYSSKFLIIMGVLAVVITLLDYYIPIVGTTKFGGTKAGVRGSMIGLIVVVFVLPVLGIVLGPFGLFGIILGPFIGAYIGEKSVGQPDNKAMRAAFGSFIGFLAGTIMKVAYGLVVLAYVIKDCIGMIFT